MPTYEYECQKCGKTFDLFQNISDKPIKKCTLCKDGKVKRLIGTGAGILFKGSGFYTTDYRSDSYNKGAKADSKPASSESSGSKTKKSKSSGSSSTKKAS